MSQISESDGGFGDDTRQATDVDDGRIGRCRVSVIDGDKGAIGVGGREIPQGKGEDGIIQYGSAVLQAECDRNGLSVGAAGVERERPISGRSAHWQDAGGVALAVGSNDAIGTKAS